MGDSVRPHHNLLAWKEAMSLVKSVYRASQNFPKEELYGLTSRMRRSAVSVPSNLAEGAARSGVKEFAQFLSIARGSLSELETQPLIAAELGYMEQSHEAFILLDKVSRLVTGLHKKMTN
ncbi:MAG: four helix bundle protein [Burkholderiales bacterium]